MGTYRQLMDSDLSIPQYLEEGGPRTPGILAGPPFLDRLPYRVRTRLQTGGNSLPLDRIVAHVAKLHDVKSDEILSRRREQTLVLARAQIAWYATEHGNATLTEVARFLRRDVSTLGRIVGRHKRRHPELFSVRIFEGLRASTNPPRVGRNAQHRQAIHSELIST